MESLFCPYELAVKLKELGFDEPCLVVTHRDGTLFSLVPAFTRESQVEGLPSIKNSECLWEDDEDSLNGIQEVATPLFQQAFRWFREKYELYSTIMFRVSAEDNNEYWDWLIKGEEVVYRHFKTYEEAELECLTKLIEIIEQQNQK